MLKTTFYDNKTHKRQTKCQLTCKYLISGSSSKRQIVQDMTEVSGLASTRTTEEDDALVSPGSKQVTVGCLGS